MPKKEQKSLASALVRLNKQKEKKEAISPVVRDHNPKLPDVIICDIDGTLAKKGERDIFDFAKCECDTVIEPVKTIVNKCFPTKVLLLTGRSEQFREPTERWLKANSIRYDTLLMRSDGDIRNDTIVKKEIFDRYINSQHNVLFIIDDRRRVVRMWRENGLFVLDVNQTEEDY